MKCVLALLFAVLVLRLQALDAPVVGAPAVSETADPNAPGKPAKESLPTTAVDPEKRELKPHDTLRFTIREDPPLSLGGEGMKVIISDGGEAMFPVSRHGDSYVKVSVAGKKLETLRREVKALLDKDYYFDCTVILDLDGINRGGFQGDAFGRVTFYGDGGLNTSISISDSKPLMLSDAILQAGGGNSLFANLKKVRIHRLNPETKQDTTLTVNVDRILKEGNREEDKQLLDGDRIEVREKTFLFN